MSNMLSWTQHAVVSKRIIPLLFLLFLILPFGLTISSLGIYQDDWVFVYNAYTRGAPGLWDFLYADGTPLSSLMNISLFHLLGVHPLRWHVAILIARWLTVIAFWLVLGGVWPASPRRNFLVSLVFAVHPFFVLQPLAFTYLHVWIGYAFLGFSFYGMILSVSRPEKFWVYMPLSMIAGTVTLVTLEYFTGLELLRPVLIWMAFRNLESDRRTRLIRTGKAFIPYLTVLCVYIWWRFFVYIVPNERRNSPVGLVMLFNDPVRGIQSILANLLPDALSIVVVAWFKTLEPSNFDLFMPGNLKFLILIMVTGLAAYLLLSRQEPEASAGASKHEGFNSEMIWLGLLILVFGLIPPYVAGIYINEKNPLWNSRFGLASMVGAALLLVCFWEAVTIQGRTRYAILAVLIGLAVGYHARYTNEYRRDWQKQANFYRQLMLRAPDLKPGSAIMTQEEILSHMGEYPTAYAINTLYSNPSNSSDPKLDYWFFSIYASFGSHFDEFLAGMPIDARDHSLYFQGHSRQSLIVSFEPEHQQCLYVIRPQDATFRHLPTLLKRAAPLSDLELIETGSIDPNEFLSAIGLDEYPDDWCMYYAKADLARQQGDWREVVAIWKAAQDKGFAPGYYFEYLPFLEAYVSLNRWDDAVAISFLAEREFPAAMRPLCDYWFAIPQSPGRDLAIEKLMQTFACME